MIQIRDMQRALLRTAGVALIFGGGVATADERCGELDECRAFIEINASDGDIGFHVLFDAEGWEQARIIDPDGKTIFKESVQLGLKEQKLTENFFESAEPVCEKKLVEEGEDDEVVTLPEFLERFPEGPYEFRNKLEGGGELAGITMLTHVIPAAPADVEFDGSEISWEYGVDLGVCTTLGGLTLADEDDIVAYEVVLEPEEDEFSSFKFTVQVPSDLHSVSVPAEYLASLDADTQLKIEVGAIEGREDGSFGNQTFTEEGGFCNNSDQKNCPDEED